MSERQNLNEVIKPVKGSWLLNKVTVQCPLCGGSHTHEIQTNEQKSGFTIQAPCGRGKYKVV